MTEPEEVQSFADRVWDLIDTLTADYSARELSLLTGLDPGLCFRLKTRDRVTLPKLETIFRLASGLNRELELSAR